MTKRSLNPGVLTDNSIGIGPVTRRPLEARAPEAALVSSRLPPKVQLADCEPAKRERRGALETAQRQERLQMVRVGKLQDPGPDATDRLPAPELTCGEEEDEERAEIEQLIGKKGRARMLRAALTDPKALNKPAASSRHLP